MKNPPNEMKNKLTNSSTVSSISIYIDNVNTMSKSTAYAYSTRLNNFRDFITNKYDNGLTIDDLLSKIKNGNEGPYDILNGYAAYLTNRNVSALTLKQHVVTVK